VTPQRRLPEAPPAGRRVAGALAVAAVALAWAAGAHGATVQVNVVDAAGKPVPDAVVFLESPEASRQVRPLAGAEMAQARRQFVPGVLVVPLGTEVHFPNQDSVRHHVYSFSPAKKFELKLYAGTPSNPVLFDKPGVVALGCNIHDQMVGWILVVPTPHYAHSAGAAGRAQIDNVPPGTYTLRAWHTRLPVGAPAHEQALTVPATAGTPVTVRLAGLQP
jgi:plastocyanin